MASGTDIETEHARRRGDLDIATLIVAALASVIAAVVTSKLWSSGTLISTAMTPVIVALVKEYAQRPVRKIGAVAKAPLVSVRTQPYRAAAPRTTVPPEVERRGRVLEADRPDPDEFEPLHTVVPPGEEATTDAPYRVYRRRPRRRWWVVGLVTGVVAFLVAVVVITVPELVGGGSVAGTGRTTLFSHHSSAKRTTTTPTDTTGTGGTSSTPTQTSGQSGSSTSSGPSGSSSSPSGSSSSPSTSTTPAPTSTTPSTGTGGAAAPPTSSSPAPPSPSSAAPPSSSGGG